MAHEAVQGRHEGLDIAVESCQGALGLLAAYRVEDGMDCVSVSGRLRLEDPRSHGPGGGGEVVQCDCCGMVEEAYVICTRWTTVAT